MSLMEYEFNSEYNLMLSACGEGELNEDDLLEFQQPDELLTGNNRWSEMLTVCVNSRKSNPAGLLPK